MAFEENIQEITLPANTDLSTKQYFFVKVVNSSGTGRVALAADGENAIGVLQNDPSAAGRDAQVAVYGVTKVYAGSAITAGQAVASDLNGEAIPAATGDIVLGIALLSGDDGDVISVLLDKSYTAA